MTSALEKLCGPGKPLNQEPPDQAEFDGLVRSGRVRLKDAQNAQNAIESRFDLAYNAAHALCLAALRQMGFRAQHRYIVFQVLPHTLGLGPEIWRVLDKCHNQRNLAEYEGMLEVDEALFAELLRATATVLQTLEQRYPRP
jgi:hypothetical protein